MTITAMEDTIRAKDIEIEDLRASLSEIKAALGLHQDAGVGDCIDEIHAMTIALKFYASAETWNQWLPDSTGNPARKALGEI
jgi:hypothetical protein